MKPLSGLRVLELARVLAGPWAGQLLADLGAEVIKVEQPGSGDDTRSWGPPFIAETGDAVAAAGYFHATNRGKFSVTADFHTEQGQALVKALVAGADIVIENFKVGGLAKYGLDYHSLRAVKPDLIYCSITGFGQTGPAAARAGYDLMIQGLSGLMDLTGEPEREPQKVGLPVADLFTGVYATVGILAALQRRHSTGEGGWVDMALLDTQMGVLANQGMNFLATGISPHRLGNLHPSIVPYQLFATRDSHIIIAAGNDGQFRRLCGVLALPELAQDARFATNPGRVAHRAVLIPLLAAAIAGLDSAGLLLALEAAGVPAGPVNTVAQAFAEPQVQFRNVQATLTRADGTRVPTVRGPVVIDGVAAMAERPSPTLGDSDALVQQALAIGEDPWAALRNS
jgi:crotonobetainyl-CoA:carnitine CoA-transferase CaiB-like acyl-CoA transferase